MKAIKQVGIWIRVSTEMQVKDESPEHHEKRARLYAEAKGWNVADVYRLDAVSGKSVIGHPETKRMLEDLKRGHITGLIFSKLARLARNTKELLEIAEYFKEYDSDLVSLAESIDTSTAAGRLFYTLFAALAEWERSEIADRVAASVPVRAKLGKPLGGAASYGYIWKNKELVIDETEASVRKQMYELFLQHRRKNTVAKILNDRGYRTRNGALFSDTTIGRLLLDPTAKGQRRANYTKSLGEGKNWVIKPESEWVITACPAIVSPELWDQCNYILEEQEKTHTKPAKKPVHIFTGLVYCKCGSKMYIPSASKKYICYECRKIRIDASDLEGIYYEHLKTFALTQEHLESNLQTANQEIASKKFQLTKTESEKDKLEIEMNKLVQLHMAGEIPKEGFGKYYKPIDERVKQMELSLPKMQAELDYLRIDYLNNDHIQRKAQNLYDRWPFFEIEEKRDIVEQITKKITVTNDAIKITFLYTPALTKFPADSQHNLTGS